MRQSTAQPGLDTQGTCGEGVLDSAVLWLAEATHSPEPFPRDHQEVPLWSGLPFS